MQVLRGHARAGRIEVDTTLPEGSEVAVVVGDATPFELAEADVLELQNRVQSAQAGNVIPAAEVMAQLRAAR